MSESEIDRLFNAIEDIRKSLDSVKNTFSEYCINTNSRFDRMDNRVTNLENAKPIEKREADRTFDKITKIVIPIMSPIFAAFLTALLLHLTQR